MGPTRPPTRATQFGSSRPHSGGDPQQRSASAGRRVSRWGPPAGTCAARSSPTTTACRPPRSNGQRYSPRHCCSVGKPFKRFTSRCGSFPVCSGGGRQVSAFALASGPIGQPAAGVGAPARRRGNTPSSQRAEPLRRATNARAARKRTGEPGSNVSPVNLASHTAAVAASLCAKRERRGRCYGTTTRPALLSLCFSQRKFSALRSERTSVSDGPCLSPAMANSQRSVRNKWVSPSSSA